MRGKVLNWNEYEGKGIISGDDGSRYPFARGGFQSTGRPIVAGLDVDFELVDGQAVNIYALPGQVSLSGDKNRIVAALLAFFVGLFGIHKFYLGKTGAGIIMLLCGTIGWLLILPGFAIAMIAFIETIIYLVKSDEQFYQDYVAGKKSWF